MRAACLLALVAAAAAAPVPFSSCGSSSDWMKTTALDISGTIAPGSSVSISAQGTAAHAVAGGNYNMAIKFLGITVRASLVLPL
jgi:hypothetical protein